MKARVLVGCATVIFVTSCNREVASPKPAPNGAAPEQPEGSLKPSHLSWGGQKTTVPLSAPRPRLRWQVSGNERGQAQSAYQVLVASDASKLQPGAADVWDSGKVKSVDSMNIQFGGEELAGRQRGVWTVRIWDKLDRPSSFAPPAPWEVAPFDEEVEGEWIGRKPGAGSANREPDRSVTYVRKTFSVPEGFKAARFYGSAFGLYEASLNGQRVGQDELAPGFSDYEKRSLSQVHDVTSLLHAGENVMGAIVAGGWCTARLGGTLGGCGLSPSRVRLTLEVTLADGTRQTIESDETWKYHSGPIESAELYAGETYDARKEMKGWDAPGFDDAGWEEVSEYDEGTERMNYLDPGPPLRVAADLTGKETEPKPGVYVFDFGRTIKGRARIALNAPSGAEVSLRYGLALSKDGRLDAKTQSGTDRYIAKGSGPETWEPRFALHEFRYVEIRGLPARSALTSIVGRVIHSQMQATGTLETSSAAINQLFASTVQAQERAFLSVPSAGRAPSERPGALLPAQAVAFTACLNRDVQGFYRKWLEDIRDAQHESAAYATVAPGYGAPEAGPSAAAAGVLVPWAHYRCYADLSALDMHVTSMGRWLESIKAKNPDGVWRNGLGSAPVDPLGSGPKTDPTLIATAEFSYAAGALAQMLRYSGGSVAEAGKPFEAMSEDARKAFNATFVLPDGRLRSDTQTAYAVAIEREVLQGHALERAGQHLAAAVERANKRPTTGLTATGLLLPALSRVGRDDLAYALLEYLAEPESSHNPARELAFAAVGEWMYDAIGGIALDPRAPAGRHVIVRPRPGAGLTQARATFDSPQGRIETAWTMEGKTFRLKVVLPPGSTATVTLPFAGSITEGGKPVKDREIDVESGSYDFVVQPS